MKAHYNQFTGAPKRGLTLEQAESLAETLRAKFSKRIRAYLCQQCGAWHIGKRKMG